MTNQVLTFAVDPYLLDFVKNNILCLGVFMLILKGLAVAIPDVEDNKIFKLLRVVCGAFLSIRKNGNGKTELDGGEPKP